MLRTLFLGLSALGLSLIVQSEASAWVNVKFSAGVNFQWESSHHGGRGCRNCSSGPVSYGSPVSYGEGYSSPSYSSGEFSGLPPATSFGQAPIGYGNSFQPASYSPYSYAPMPYYQYGINYGR